MYPCYHRNEVLSSSISWCVSKNSSNNNFNLIEYRYRSRLNTRTRLQCQIDDIMILMDLLSSHEKGLVAAIGWNCSFGLWSLQSTRTNERRYRRTADIRHSAGNVALALERACAKYESSTWTLRDLYVNSTWTLRDLYEVWRERKSHGRLPNHDSQQKFLRRCLQLRQSRRPEIVYESTNIVPKTKTNSKHYRKRTYEQKEWGKYRNWRPREFQFRRFASARDHVGSVVTVRSVFVEFKKWFFVSCYFTKVLYFLPSLSIINCNQRGIH